MVAYFVRRVVGGVVKVLLAWLVIYSLIVYAPVPVPSPTGFGYFPHPTDKYYLKYLYHFLHMDKPFPLNYLTWLFDPNGEAEEYLLIAPINSRADPMPRAIDAGGILSGDLGRSVTVDRGRPVGDVYGGSEGMSGALLGVMVVLMAVAVTQR